MRLKSRFFSLMLLTSIFVNNINIPVYANDSQEPKQANIKSNFSITIPKSLQLYKDSDDSYVTNYRINIDGDIGDDEILKVIPDENFYLKSDNKDDVIASVNQENTFWYNTQLKNQTSGNITANLSAGNWQGNLNFEISLEKDENAYKYTTLTFSSEKIEVVKNLEEEIKVYFNEKDVTNLVNFKVDNDLVNIAGGKIKGLNEGTADIEVSYNLSNEDGFNNQKTIISSFEVEVIPCEHEYTLLEETDATCILDSTEKYKCDICGEIKTEHKTKAFGHTEGESVEIENILPTCTQEGKITTLTSCTVCGEEISKKTEIIPQLNHEYEEDEIISAATCTEDGIKLLKCSVCGDEKTEAISSTGHTEGKWEISVEPTCTSEGEEIKKCTICDAIIDTKVVDPLGHDYTEEEIPSTCIKEGKLIKSCSRCDYKEEEIIPTKDHEISDFITVKDPSCTEAGEKRKICEVCKEIIESKDIPATGHTPSKMVIENEVPATCTENGSYDEVIYCDTCEDELSRISKTTNKLGHLQDDPVGELETQPSCTEEGIAWQVTYCKNCGEELMREKETTQPLGHDYIEGICTRCGDALPDLTVTASGFTGDYDKKEHSILVVSEGSTILYSKDNKTWTEENPSFTEVGTYTVYYKISKEGYKTITGSCEVIINEASYDITFDANSGSVTTTSKTIKNNTEYGMLPTPTRTGYTFAGWFTESGEKVTDATIFTSNTPQTLYAQWNPINYAINYNLNGGSISGQKTTYTAETGTFTLPTPTKSGYFFTGWTGSNGTTPQKTVNIIKGSTGNKNYTANWSTTAIGYIGNEAYDLKIEQGRAFVKVFAHDSRNNNFFKTESEVLNTGSRTSTKYSRLNSLDSLKTSTESKYVFMLRYPKEGKYYNEFRDKDDVNIWKQTKKPQNESHADTTDGKAFVTGYEAISIDLSEVYWGGLEKSTYQKGTYLDGSTAHNNWFYAIGCHEQWGSGEGAMSTIPGGIRTDGTNTSSIFLVELYLQTDLNKFTIK